MFDLLLYLIMIIIGFIAGTLLRAKKEKLGFVTRLQTLSIMLLLLMMGVKMGANAEVIANIKTIGLYALIFTVLVIGCTLISLTVVRRLMKVNKQGVLQGEGITRDKVEEEVAKSFDAMTFIIVGCVIVGMSLGYFVDSHDLISGAFLQEILNRLIQLGLCLLLVFVGLDMGFDEALISNLRAMGIRALAFPIATIIGTMAGAIIALLVIPVTLQETLAIGGGFGWYTLAPAIIMDAGHVNASAISFIHNVLRELLSIIIIPFVARYIGAIEAGCVAGAPSMDVCLPVIGRATNGSVVIYAFVNGVIISLLVPVIVSVIMQF